MNINPHFRPLSANFTKTQTIRRQFADELFECLPILWHWRLKGQGKKSVNQGICS